MSVRVATTTAMRAIPTANLSRDVDHTVFVESAGYHYQYVRGGTAAYVTDEVVADRDGQGQWIRLWIGNRTFSSVGSMRTAAGPFLPSIQYRTLGALAEGDGGHGEYEWNTTSTDDDDGALTIKVSAVSVGRFKFRKPDNRLFPLAASNLDRTGVTPVGAALQALMIKLYAAGYLGIDGGTGKYNLTGSACRLPPRAEWDPWIFANGTWFGTNNFTSVLAFDMYFEIGSTGLGENHPLTTPPYGVRTWTQTVHAGDYTFTGVADIRNLSVGDTIYVKLGADSTDASGVWWSGFYTKIAAITPTTGNAGNIKIDRPVPETPQYPLASYNINSLRFGNQHDLYKVTEFQDNIKFINCTFSNLLIASVGARNCLFENPFIPTAAAPFSFYAHDHLRIDNAYVDSLMGVNTSGGDPAVDPYANYGWFIITNAGRDATINNLTINRFSGSIGILDTESQNRGTSFTGRTKIRFEQSVSRVLNSFLDTPHSTEPIRIDDIEIDGGGESAGWSPNVRIGRLRLGTTRQGDPGNPQLAFISANQVEGALVFKGAEYKNRRVDQVLLTKIGVNATTTFAIPKHGVVRNLRVYSSSLTGVTDWHVHGGSWPGSNMLSYMTAGTWSRLEGPANLSLAASNFASDVQTVKISTDGTFSANTFFFLEIEVLGSDGQPNIIPDPNFSDSSTPLLTAGSGAPAVAAAAFTERYLDVTNNVWYAPVSLGTGAGDWGRQSGAVAYSELSGNTGTAVGRPRIEELILNASITSNTTAAATWTGDKYRSLRYELRTITGSGLCTITLGGVSGAYESGITYTSGAGAPAAASGASWDVTGLNNSTSRGEIWCLNDGSRKAISATYYDPSTPNRGWVNGSHSDSSSNVTGITFTMGASATFKVTVWGVPK